MAVEYEEACELERACAESRALNGEIACFFILILPHGKVLPLRLFRKPEEPLFP